MNMDAIGMVSVFPHMNGWLYLKTLSSASLESY
jgi:hypothetical protein